MSQAEIIVQLIAGLSRGGLYFLVAAGLTLTLGAMDVINLAHGSFYMLGAYLATVVITVFGVGAGFGLAWVLVPVGVMVIVAVVEKVVMRRIYGRGHFVQLLTTFAIVLIVDDLVRSVFGTDPRTVGRPSWLSGSVDVLGLPVPVYNFFIMVIAAAVAVGLFLLLGRTSYGRRIRASVDDPEMLAAAGVNLQAVRMGVFLLAGCLAGFAGVVVAPAAAVQPGMDVTIIITAFAVTIIGGLGSITGALVGAVIVGVTESIGLFYIERGSLAIIFVIMAVVLALRPTGIFGLKRAA